MGLYTSGRDRRVTTRNTTVSRNRRHSRGRFSLGHYPNEVLIAGLLNLDIIDTTGPDVLYSGGLSHVL